MPKPYPPSRAAGRVLRGLIRLQDHLAYRTPPQWLDRCQFYIVAQAARAIKRTHVERALCL